MFLTFSLVYSQKSTTDLDKYATNELLGLYDMNRDDTIFAKQIASEYLKRGSAKKDTIMIARGYDRLARISDYSSSLLYIDSIINLTKNINHITYPGLAYLLKYKVLSKSGNYYKAVENLIVSSNIALQRENIGQYLFASDLITYYKAYLGHPREALEILNYNDSIIETQYFQEKLKKESRVDFQNRLKSLKLKFRYNNNLSRIVCFIELGEINTAEKIYDSTIKMLRSNNDSTMVRSFYETGMEISYFKSDYIKTLKFIDSLKSLSKKNVETPNIYFFKGMAKLQLGFKQDAIRSFESADSLYQIGNKLLFPRHRKLYRELLKYYDEINDKKTEIEYLNRLITWDSLLSNNYKIIHPKILLEFETERLINKKEALIKNLRIENGKRKRQSIMISFFLFITAGSSVFYFNKQKQYKKRFNSLLEKGLSLPTENNKTPSSGGISAHVIEQILNQLEEFEQSEAYLAQDVSLQSVAKKFKTNSSYLSKVINLKKDKNFSQYINELRIEFAVNELKRNARFRKYTIRAIAEEVGFGNSQSFSKAFYKRTGLQPSYFVRNLNKRLTEHAS